MKRKTNLTSTNLFFILGTFVTSLLFSKLTWAQGSLELSCRSKAKELAAETYKGCMTEGRQSQIENIRNEYKEKLSDLKSHYDKELKKISGQPEGNHSSSLGNTIKTHLAEKKADPKRLKQRTTNRMPPKKSNTKVIDFTAPSGDSQNGSKDQESETPQASRTSENNAEIEVVELQAQEE